MLKSTDLNSTLNSNMFVSQNKSLAHGVAVLFAYSVWLASARVS